MLTCKCGCGRMEPVWYRWKAGHSTLSPFCAVDVYVPGSLEVVMESQDWEMSEICRLQSLTRDAGLACQQESFLHAY